MHGTVTRAASILGLLLCGGCGAGPSAPAPAATDSAAGQATIRAIGIPNEKQPLPGLITGGQPTREQLAEAARAGVGTVINLRAIGEDGRLEGEAAFVDGLGMTYVEIPIAQPTDLDLEAALQLARALQASAGRTVLLHCASGNRVGALLAVKAALVDGASVDEALELGRRGGLTRLEEATREIVTRAASPPGD